MNAETALWDVHPARCPRSRGGRCREGDRGGETVRHSANVTYCLFRGGCTAPCRSRGDGMIGAADVRVPLSVDIRIIEKSTLPPPLLHPPVCAADRSLRTFHAEHMGYCK